MKINSVSCKKEDEILSVFSVEFSVVKSEIHYFLIVLLDLEHDHLWILHF